MAHERIVDDEGSVPRDTNTARLFFRTLNAVESVYKTVFGDELVAAPVVEDGAAGTAWEFRRGPCRVVLIPLSDEGVMAALYHTRRVVVRRQCYNIVDACDLITAMAIELAREATVKAVRTFDVP